MTPMRPRVMLACAMAAFVAAGAFAQATNYTSVEATAGKQIQLTYHATAHKSTCAPAPLPTVKIMQPPKAGALIVRKAVLTTDKIAGCPRLKVPAQVVFYQAKENYTGPDHVAYEVTDANGEVGTFDVSITVNPAPAPNAPPGEMGTKL